MLAGLGLAARDVPRPWSPRVLDDRLMLVVTGVGKANAAGAIARAGGGRYSLVLSMGIAGALPASGAPRVGQTLLVEACTLADEGLATHDRFITQSQMGFPAVEGVGERFGTDPAVLAALRPLADAVGGVATVSSCSGSDGRAARIAARTGALCEDMESAAAALAACRLGLPFAGLRVVSNRTGDRDRQGWRLELALSVLGRLAGAL